MRYLALAAAFLFVFPCTGCKGSKIKKRELFLQKMAQSQDKYAKLATSQEVDGERATEATNFVEFTNTETVMTGKTTKRETAALVSQLYAAGAQRVSCIYVEKEATFKAKMCNSILVEMPRDEDKRKQVLKAFTKVEREFWGEFADKKPEEGLKYLLLDMDP